MDTFIPITLPSRCLTYIDPTGSSVNSDTVSARAYQGGDQLYLTQINPLNLERNYFEVLKSVLRGVDPLQLTVGDRMYLIVWEYINSYDKFMSVKTICEHCLKEVEVSVDLTTLDKVMLTEDFKQPYSITLPVSKEKISLNLLTVEDEIAVEKYSKKHPEDALHYRYARTISSEQDVELLKNKIDSMAAKDFLAIMAFQDDFFHGPELRSTFVCPTKGCGEEQEVIIPFRLEFLFPDVSKFSVSSRKGV